MPKKLETSIDTEFGTAYIDNKGYYKVSSRKKQLHVLLYEKYIAKIPLGYELHHKDENKLNNKLDNLLIITHQDHGRLHRKRIYKDKEEYKMCNCCGVLRKINLFHKRGGHRRGDPNNVRHPCKYCRHDEYLKRKQRERS